MFSKFSQRLNVVSSFPRHFMISFRKARNLPAVCWFRRAGGDRIYLVFDNQLPAALKKLPFDRHLSLQNVRKVVSEADGYQPHLIAPEQGYRRLIDGSLSFFKGPAEASVDAVILLSLHLFLMLVLTIINTSSVEVLWTIKEAFSVMFCRFYIKLVYAWRNVIP